MKIFTNKNQLKKNIKKGIKLGFVPTMGAFHKGHISLIKKSIKMCDKTIVSIFINKPQFNKKKDFNEYPRDLSKDISILKKIKVNYVYLPKYREIYPRGPNLGIKISKFSNQLCGKFRPKHFKSVVDVVDRFLKIIKPNKIFLGKKDYQQLKIIEDYIVVNKINTKVIKCKTIREINGLACSSRNFILSTNEKNLASKVYKIIKKNKIKIIKNKHLLTKIKKQIYKIGINKIEYLNLINLKNLESRKKNFYKVFISFYLRSVRLIDNI